MKCFKTHSIRHVLAALLIAVAASAQAEIYDVSGGTIEVPDAFAFEHIRSTDSFIGKMTRKSDGFTIGFDVGVMAGTHMSPKTEDQCDLFRIHKINGHLAWTGIEKVDGSKRKITTTIYDFGVRFRRYGEEKNRVNKLPAEEREKEAQQVKALRAQVPEKPEFEPANFWAEITSEIDLADFLLIVSSYQPKAFTAPPFELSIIPENRSENLSGISWANDCKSGFFVILSNLTDKAQPIFETWNSWGYQSISFEMTLPSGDTSTVTVKQQFFTRNFSSTFVIPPGGHQVFPITLNEVWEGNPAFGGKGRTRVNLKAVYEIDVSPESKEQGIWTGRVESEPIEVEVHHW